MASPIYLALGSGGLVVTSPDGKKWNDHEANRDWNFVTALFGPTNAVACGRKKLTLYSPDGRRWEPASGDFPFDLVSFALHGDKFVGMGADVVTIGAAKAFLAVSDNGRKWEIVGNIADGKRAGRAAASDGKRLVVVGDRGFKAVTDDLKDWKVADDQKAVDTLINVTFGAGRFVGGGLHGLRMSSSDGLNWDRAPGGEEGEHINSMLWTGKEFVGVGLGATYRSPDGRTWTRTPNVNAPADAAYGPGGFVGTQWKGRLLHSPDAITWVEVAKFPSNINKVVAGTV